MYTEYKSTAHLIPGNHIRKAVWYGHLGETACVFDSGSAQGFCLNKENPPDFQIWRRKNGRENDLASRADRFSCFIKFGKRDKGPLDLVLALDSGGIPVNPGEDDGMNSVQRMYM
ncbi:predicted protein [Coccidioides posadasii str. Silveira]|uniref:Predicted protein n=2 Tax=Coccidioides posadasii TaxID=199306 RepID=E9D984_COCPS|nr:predicted protein [Coccidioides posadasii str. Silveira]KMM70023.1 hypothetical protein CPAG_06335 [Coccidioides posadasii RMSCC 3488]